MFAPTVITWLIIIFGLITCLPLMVAQAMLLFKPDSLKVKEILIGPGEDWRDESHFRSALGLAAADWLIFFPIFVAAIAGIVTARYWGYLLLAVSGAVQLYINTFLWFFERKYVYPSNGPLKYYTYLWGHFIYWGLAALAYGLSRFSAV